jgi:transposase
MRAGRPTAEPDPMATLRRMIQQEPGRISRRAQAVAWWLGGASPPRVSLLLGVARGTVQRWCARFRAEGIAGLWDRRRTGRPRTAGEEAEKTVRACLEPLTKPMDRIETDERAPERNKGLVDIHASLVAHPQSPKLIEPGHGALNHPPMLAERGAGVDALARDPNPNAAITHRLTATRDVVRLIGGPRGGPHPSLTRGLFDGRNGVEQGFEGNGIVPVGSAQADGERRAPAAGHNVTLRARFAAIRGIRPGLAPPLLAGTLALSRQARLQSIWPAVPSRSSKAWWRRSQTPAACQSRKRRQQSSRRRSRVPAAAFPTECRRGAQRRCRSNRRGRRSAAARPWVWAAPAATVVRWRPRVRLRPMACACLLPMQAPFHGFVRSS